MAVTHPVPEEIEFIVKKSGAELFREIYRLLPTAEVEDYFKMGMWKDDVMRLDVALLHAHRLEAGAPDPLPIEEVNPPDMPTAAATAGGYQAAGMQRALISPALSGGVPPKVGEAGGAVAIEIRLMSLFVAKWKLDPSKTKTILTELTPPRRCYVLQNFKLEGASSPEEATNALEKYVADCQTNNLWEEAEKTAAKNAEAKAAAAKEGGVVPPKAAGGLIPAGLGVKRPLEAAAAAIDPAKRPKMPSPVAPKMGGAASWPASMQGLAAAKAGAASWAAGARPQMVQPRW